MFIFILAIVPSFVFIVLICCLKKDMLVQHNISFPKVVGLFAKKNKNEPSPPRAQPTRAADRHWGTSDDGAYIADYTGQGLHPPTTRAPARVKMAAHTR